MHAQTWLIIIVLGIVAVASAYAIGHAAGMDRVRNEKDNAVAAACPTCVNFTESAERLEGIGARISGVEWFGHRDADVDPVEDANWILRVAISHARRVRLHQNTKAVVMHRESKHRDANGDRIDS